VLPVPVEELVPMLPLVPIEPLVPMELLVPRVADVPIEPLDAEPVLQLPPLAVPLVPVLRPLVPIDALPLTELLPLIEPLRLEELLWVEYVLRSLLMS
jgi:hypothetical protein